MSVFLYSYFDKIGMQNQNDTRNLQRLIDDCVISKVEREGTTIDTFKAHISSKKWGKYEWTADSKVTISITYADAYKKAATFRFVVGTFEEHWYGDKVEFTAQ